MSGIPLVKTWAELRDQIAADFGDFNHYEQSLVQEAILSAMKVPRAGYVEIHESKGEAWQELSRLVSENAVPGRYFGQAVAIDGTDALVCDAKGGLYAFRRAEGEWTTQQRISAPCSNVAMRKGWAVVTAYWKASARVFHNDHGLWRQTQTLTPHDYRVREGRGEDFSTFGEALAMLDETILIGNPIGGEGHRGEVYVYRRSEDQWRQSQVLSASSPVWGFGRSIAGAGDYLAIGSPGTGELDTPTMRSGSVLLYVRKDEGWRLLRHLVPEARPKFTQFGERVLITSAANPALLIKSSKTLYRHPL